MAQGRARSFRIAGVGSILLALLASLCLAWCAAASASEAPARHPSAFHGHHHHHKHRHHRRHRAPFAQMLPGIQKALGSSLGLAALGQPPASGAGEEIEPYSKHPSELKPYYLCPPPTKTRAGCTAVGTPNPRKLREAGLPTPSYEGTGVGQAFSPSDLRSAYNLSAEGGAGQTVAITIAYDDPKAEEDLAYYRSYYSLPACTTANGCFKKVNQKGEAGNYPKADVGWATETSLDLDMVSAACPKCHILLVEANSESSEDLYPAVEEAAKYELPGGAHAVAISDSWTLRGEYPQEAEDDHYFHHPGVPVLFATGDWEYEPNYPSASPEVVAVGGTRLAKASNSRGWYESAWSATGGGCSAYEEKPAWQQGSECAKRLTADVSAVADPATPVSVYDTYGGYGGWFAWGGTSAATPLMAGIEALSSSAFRSAGPSAFRYAGWGGELFDPAEGENKANCLNYLCQGEAGYDGPTGWGSPEGPLSLPVAVTEGVSVASTSKATLHGSVCPGDIETKYRFEYGETSSYGTSVPVPDASAGSGSAYVEVSRTIEGLKAKTTYHYRLTATNSEGTFHGVDRTLGTSTPSVSAGVATEVHANDATLHGTVNPEGSSTSYWFEYGPSASYGRKAPLNFKDVGSGTGAAAVSATVNLLTGSHIYHFRVVAKNAAGTSYGKDETFTTPAAQWSTRLLPKAPKNPNPGDRPYDAELVGVSCVTPEDCMAVGNYSSYLEMMESERWDGSEWTAAPMATPKEARESILTDVSCTSESWCAAVGLYSAKPIAEQEGLPLIETWDGVKWSAAYPPLPSGAWHEALNSIQLLGVSCTSQSACMAVGQYETEGAPYLHPLVYRWDGKEWSLLSMSTPTNSNYKFFAKDVSCLSASWCMVVGGHASTTQQWDNQMAEVWNGTGWEIVKQDAPDPTNEASRLNAVSCATQSKCVVPTFDVGITEGTPPVERTTGTLGVGAWTRDSLPSLPEARYAEPKRISCSAVNACTAVGYAAVRGGSAPVIYRWDGSKWSLQTTSDPLQEEEGALAAPYSGFNDVSCPSPSNCLAVGLARLQSGELRAMAELYRAPGPKSRTRSATQISGTGATMNATVDPEGLKTTYQFEYGQTCAYGSALPASPKEAGSGTSDMALSEALGSLQPLTTYHYRVAATNSEGTTYGEDRAFTTAGRPAVTPEAPTEIGSNKATFHASINPDGLATTYKVEWGETTAYGHSSSTAEIGSGMSSVHASYSTWPGFVLSPKTTYHYRFFATNSEGATYGPDQTVTTIATPTIRSVAVTNVTAHSMLLHAVINPEGGETTYRFIYGHNEITELETTSGVLSGGFSDTEVTKEITGLEPIQSYKIEAIAESPGGNAGLQMGSYTTLGVPPVLTLNSASNVEQSKATLRGTVNPEGAWGVSYWFEYSPTTAYGKTAGSKTMSGNRSPVSVSTTVEGLTEGTEYHYRLVAEDSAGKTYSSDGTFKTLIHRPVNTTLPSISPEAPKVGVTETVLNGAWSYSPTSYSYHWNRCNSEGKECTWIPGATESTYTPVKADGARAFVVEVGATNTGGTEWAKTKPTTALAPSEPPAIVTAVAENVSSSEVTLEGLIGPEGSSTSYYFEYGQTASYGSQVPVTPAGIGAGLSRVGVSNAVGGLSPGTTYHYRLVASNQLGTSYSPDATFTTLKVPKATTEAATSVKATEVTLNASVNPEGGATSYYFEYGTTTSYGAKVPTTAKEIGSGTSSVAVSQTLASLTQGTTYHYRVVAESAAGLAKGGDLSFETKAGKWTLQSMPSTSSAYLFLEDVSCASAEECIAVGRNGSASLAERWNGSEWSTMTSPAGGGTLSDVSCTSSAFCLAVSSGFKVQRWNGSEWAILTPAIPSGATSDELQGVSCTSSSACVVVGTYASGSASHTLAESWNGSGWTILSTPSEGTGGNSLVAVSCTSSTSCTVIGAENGGSKQVALRWNGSEWSALASPGKEPSTDVACTAANACVAVSGSKAKRWNGSEWITEAVPAPESAVNGPVLSRVSCSSAGSCTAVGDFQEAIYEEDEEVGTRSVPLAEHWDGSKWSVQATAQPEGDGHFEGISCISAAKCAAVGRHDLPGGGWKPLAERYGVAPRATTEPATLVKANTATLNGLVNPEGSVTTYRFEYGTTAAYGSSAPAPAAEVGSGLEDVEASIDLEGLEPSTTYHFRIVATSAEGAAYGKDETFTTKDTATYISSFGTKGSGNGQFSGPTSTAIDSSGNLWVSDSVNDRVEEFNPKGEYVRQFGKAGTGNGQFQYPRGIAIDSSGNVWVVDEGNDRVEEFNPKGEYLSKFGSYGWEDDQLRYPNDVAIDPSGNLWVVDAGNALVKEFNSKGEYIRQIGIPYSEGSENGQFYWPEGIAIDQEGHVWVSDTSNSRVQEFNSKGEYLGQFGSEGTGNGQFQYPEGLTFDSEGHVWVADTSNSRIQEFNSKGEYLGKLGKEGSGEGQFRYPYDVAIDPSGNLWVVDSGNDRVQEWR